MRYQDQSRGVFSTRHHFDGLSIRQRGQLKREQQLQAQRERAKVRELPDLVTKLTIPILWNELILQWETLGVNPTRAAIELKLAHIHLETGLNACHNWNLGNIKAHPQDGQHWQFFACGEEIHESQLKGVQAMGTGLVQLVNRYLRAGEWMLSVRILPKHPWAKFAAFESIGDGMAFQLRYLKDPKHRGVLEALMSGAPGAYSAALGAVGYYTASPQVYASTLQKRLAIVREACKALDWGDVC